MVIAKYESAEHGRSYKHQMSHWCTNLAGINKWKNFLSSCHTSRDIGQNAYCCSTAPPSGQWESAFLAESFHTYCTYPPSFMLLALIVFAVDRVSAEKKKNNNKYSRKAAIDGPSTARWFSKPPETLQLSLQFHCKKTKKKKTKSKIIFWKCPKPMAKKEFWGRASQFRRCGSKCLKLYNSANTRPMKIWGKNNGMNSPLEGSSHTRHKIAI